MKKLEIKQKKRLKQILASNRLISSDDAARRKVFLHEMEVLEVCEGVLDMKAATNEFLSILRTHLEKENAPDGKQWLWKFLQNFLEMYGDDLPADDHAFLTELIQSDPALSPSRGGLPLSGNRKIDNRIIVEFDLEDVEETVLNALRPKTGAFAFSISVPCPDICQKYVIKRLEKQIQGKCGRPVERWNIYIKPEDIDVPIAPVDRLETDLSGSVSEWFNNTSPVALLVCFWNYSVVSTENIISECWSKILEDYGERLIEQAHTLVFLWISVNQTAVLMEEKERFRLLNLPEQFKREDVEAHFKLQLKNNGIDDVTIRAAIEKIMEYEGELLPTYGRMADIIRRL